MECPDCGYDMEAEWTCPACGKEVEGSYVRDGYSMPDELMTE